MLRSLTQSCVALSLLLATSCHFVTVPKPIGEVLKNSGRNDLTGVWSVTFPDNERAEALIGKVPQRKGFLLVCHDDDGSITIPVHYLSHARDKLLAARVALSRHGTYFFAHLSLGDLAGAEDKAWIEWLGQDDRWLFALAKVQPSEELEFFDCDPIEFEKALQARKLKGEIIHRGTFTKEVSITQGLEQYISDNGPAKLFRRPPVQVNLNQFKMERTMTPQNPTWPYIYAELMQPVASIGAVGAPLQEAQEKELQGRWHNPLYHPLGEPFEFEIGKDYCFVTADDTNEEVRYLNVRSFLDEPAFNAFSFFRIDWDKRQGKLLLFPPKRNIFRRAVRNKLLAGTCREQCGVCCLLISDTALDAFIDPKKASEQFDMNKPILVLTRKPEDSTKP